MRVHGSCTTAMGRVLSALLAASCAVAYSCDNPGLPSHPADEVPEYSVSYDGNGATGGSAPLRQVKAPGATATIAGNDGGDPLVCAGHAFSGWNTAADGGGADYAVGASYDDDADLRLYARWLSLAPTVCLVGVPSMDSTSALVTISVESYGFGASPAGTDALGVVWNTTGLPSYGTSDACLASDGTVLQYTIYLSPGTTYYVRPFARNSLGYLSYGNQVSLTTP